MSTSDISPDALQAFIAERVLKLDDHLIWIGTSDSRLRRTVQKSLLGQSITSDDKIVSSCQYPACIAHLKRVHRWIGRKLRQRFPNLAKARHENNAHHLRPELGYGSRNSNHKLQESDVLWIRQHSRIECIAHYSQITERAIDLIRARKTWKSI